MEKITKKVIGMIGLMFLCMLSVISHEKMVQAESVVSLGDTWTNGYWTEDDTEDEHMYQFTIPSDGKVTVTCQSIMDHPWSIYLMDKDCTESYNHDGNGFGGSTTFSEYLKAGTYGIEFEASFGAESGEYKFKVQFTAVNCNVPEPNNDFVSATPISLNQLQQGVLTDTNPEDYFKIQLNRATTLKVVTTGEDARRVSLYNGDFVKIKSDYFYSGADMLEEYLAPGTYYIQMEKDDDTPYTLKCVSYQYVTGIRLRSSLLVVKKGTSANLLSAVTPSDATQKTLKWTTSDSSVATVSSTGKVTAKAVGYANITASTIDGSNISKMATVIVSPAKASLKKLQLYKYNKRQISIKVKGQKNVYYQYQYAKNKKFKKAKSIRSNYTSVTTSTLSKKKKYYVRVRAYYEYNGKKYYGAWSKAMSIRTKK